MTLDRELVTRKLLLIAADLNPLRQIHEKGAAAFHSSAIDQAVVERLLERMITRMIDINYHVITALGHPPPSDYHGSFLKLGELGILDAAFARQIARAAGLRNRLVHDYEDLEAQKVFEALGSALQDVPVYVSRIDDRVKMSPA